MASYPHPDGFVPLIGGSGSGGDGNGDGENCGEANDKALELGAMVGVGKQTAGGSGREESTGKGTREMRTKEEVAASKREAKLRQQAFDNALPVLPPPEKVVLVDSGAALADAHLALSSCNVLGIDTETKPLFRVGEAPHPPALLQVAGMRMESARAEDDVAAAKVASVYVFDLLALLPARQEGWGSQFSRIMAPLLASPETLLLGVGIEEDLRELARHYGSSVPCFLEVVRGVVDLGSAKCEGAQGLRRLLAEYAGFRLVKSQAVSNWGQRPLSSKQLAYAANDARAALMVYAAAGASAFTGKPRDIAIGEVVIAECRFCGNRGLKSATVQCRKDCGWLKWRDEEAKRYLAKGAGGTEEAQNGQEENLESLDVPQAPWERIPHYRRVQIPVLSSEMLVLEEAARQYRVKNHAAKQRLKKERKKKTKTLERSKASSVNKTTNKEA